MKRAKQTSESIELGILLALSGGFMDAYSYLARGQVFANAQTGNMLLFGVNLARGQFQHALHYLCPVLAFGLGIFLAEFVHFQKIQKVHWRQVTLLIEIIILFKAIKRLFLIISNSYMQNGDTTKGMTNKTPQPQSPSTRDKRKRLYSYHAQR